MRPDEPGAPVPPQPPEPDRPTPATGLPLPGRPGPGLLVRRGAFTVVLVVVALSVVVTVLVDFRLGGYLLSGALLLAAASRAFLPDWLCLGLLVRTRRIDVATLLVLAAAVALASDVVPGT